MRPLCFTLDSEIECEDVNLVHKEDMLDSRDTRVGRATISIQSSSTILQFRRRIPKIWKPIHIASPSRSKKTIREKSKNSPIPIMGSVRSARARGTRANTDKTRTKKAKKNMGENTKLYWERARCGAARRRAGERRRAIERWFYLALKPSSGNLHIHTVAVDLTRRETA